MFFNGSFFWFAMGIVSVVVVAGFRAFAKDRGWKISLGNAMVGVLCYAIFLLSFYAWGTLMGENEGGAGMKILLLGLVLAIVLAVILWVRVSRSSRKKVVRP